MTRRTLALLATLAVVLLAVCACQPTPPGPPAPTPATVDVYGDSVTWGATWGHDFAAGRPTGTTVRTSSWLGWTYADVQTDATARAAQGYAETVVVALGTNNARDGWQATDTAALRQLVATFHPSTCIVLVTPAVVSTRTAAAWPQLAAGVYGSHVAMYDLQRARPGTVVAPWYAAVSADPSLLAADGIHLPVDPATNLAVTRSANAWAATVWAGVNACP
jgi:hypothetical protein